MTATDLVLTVTELLRKAKVVGKFVEFYGAGTALLSVPDRADAANMAPEYGATMGFFSVDDKTVEWLRGNGRTADEIEAFEAYFKAQGLFGTPESGSIDFSESLTLDLGHRRAQPGWPQAAAGPHRDRQAVEEVRRAAGHAGRRQRLQPAADHRGAARGHGQRHRGSHGDVLIAAITSCTNTSNPSGKMLAAGLLAKKAVAAGLKVRPHIKTCWRPARASSPSTWRRPACCRRWRRWASTAAYGCSRYQRGRPQRRN